MPRSIHRRFAPLCMLLALVFTLACPAALCEGSAEPAVSEIIYGYSENGRPLSCYQIGPDDAARSLLLVFGVHGFEDAYDHDGEVLRLIAQRVIDFYAAPSQLLSDFTLYVIPCANPDGLLEGRSKNGFGRCNAIGLDINRDFPVNWHSDYHSRVKTGSEPFSTAEARAIRDLVHRLSPSYAVDIHGWIDAVYGSGVLAECFIDAFGMHTRSIRSGGTLAQWLQTVSGEAILLELPPNPDENAYVERNSEKLIQAIRMLSEHSAAS